MKKVLIISLSVFLFACKNGKKDTGTTETTASTEATTTGTTTEIPTTGEASSNSTIQVEGKELKLNSSILVDKDKKNLKVGAPYRGMITTSNGPDNEGVIIRFVFDTKSGVYPLTGMSYTRGNGDKAEQYGGLMGGEEKIYDAKVNLTECKDLGSNNAGGHRWSISGTVENLTIPAMKLMLLDKEKKHPSEVKIDKYSFTGLTFDDNAEELLQKAMEQLDKMKKN